MKKIALLITLLFLATPAWADIPLSGLPVGTTAIGTDTIPVVQAGPTDRQIAINIIGGAIFNNVTSICSLAPATCGAFFGFVMPQWYGGFCGSLWNVDSSAQDDGPGIAAALATGYTVMIPYPGCKIATTVKYTANQQNMSSFNTEIIYNQNNTYNLAGNGNIFVPNNLSATAQNCAIDFNGYAEVGLSNIRMHANNEPNGSAALCDSYSDGSGNGPRNHSDDFTHIQNFSASNFGAMLGTPTNSTGVPIAQPCNTGSCMGGSYIQLIMENWFSDHNFWGIHLNMSDAHFNNFYVDNAAVALSNYGGYGSGMWSNGRIEYSGDPVIGPGVVYLSAGGGFSAWEMTNIEFDHNQTACIDIGPTNELTLSGGWMHNCALSGVAGHDGAIVLEDGAGPFSMSNMLNFADFLSHPHYGLVTIGTSSYVSFKDSTIDSLSTVAPFSWASTPTNVNIDGLVGSTPIPSMKTNKLALGIGTSPPLSQLDVGSAGIVIGTAYAGVSAAPTDSLLISSKLGIGTANPTSKLTVVGLGTTAPIGTTAGAGTVCADSNGAFYVKPTCP
jgi:hypothetical protein